MALPFLFAIERCIRAVETLLFIMGTIIKLLIIFNESISVRKIF